MTGLVRKAMLLLAVCGLFAASVASANVPDPGQSVLPNGITLVGSTGVTPDPLGTKSVVVKDVGGFAINNSSVVVDFGACSEVRLCDTQLDGSTDACPTQRTVRLFTDPSGVATFTTIGGGVDPLGAAQPATCAKIYADGVLLGSVNVAAYDLNGAGGVTAADLSIWLAYSGLGTNPRVGDYDYNGSVSAADLSLWLTASGGGGSTSSCGSYCP